MSELALSKENISFHTGFVQAFFFLESAILQKEMTAYFAQHCQRLSKITVNELIC